MTILFCILYLFIIIDAQYDSHISFSVESGYYDSNFELKINGGKGYQIFYTLDGSEPTANDYLYSPGSSILISDATDNDNIYSARKDLSTAFYTELVEQFSYGNPNYTIPNYKVDKCNIVRASVFDEDGKCLHSIQAVYFVNYDKKKGYDNIYVASLVTDPQNLFDYEKGIYVTGKTFDDFVKNDLGKETYPYTPYWWRWNTNYSIQGRESEREAFVTIFDTDQKEVLSQKCGIRIQGRGSRGFLPKSIGCFARNEYSGSNEFQANLFEKNMFQHKFVFFSGSDDNIYKVKDYLVNYMEQGLPFATMKFIPCALFLNGEYWGVYYITENYNADYISDYYKVSKDNIIMFKNGEMSEGVPEEVNYFIETNAFIMENDMTLPENYQKACQLIDVENYISYYAAQIYIARNGDWPTGNYAAWRCREYEDSAYGDCRWRWMLFDVNSTSLEIEDVEFDTISYIIENDPVFASLYLNDTFRVELAKQILHIGGENFSYNRCEEFLDEYAKQMKEPIIQSNLRFYNKTMDKDFDENVKNLKLFFKHRYDAVWELLLNNMGEEWLMQNGIQK